MQGEGFEPTKALSHKVSYPVELRLHCLRKSFGSMRITRHILILWRVKPSATFLRKKGGYGVLSLARLTWLWNPCENNFGGIDLNIADGKRYVGDFLWRAKK